MASLGLTTKSLMSDVPAETSSTNALAEYVDGLEDEKRSRGLDPHHSGDVQLIETLQRGIVQGTLNDAHVKKLMNRNPVAAPIFADALSKQAQFKSSQGDINRIYSDNFRPEQQALPEQTMALNTPQGTMDQQLPGKDYQPAKANYPNAILEFNHAGYPERADALAKQQKELGSGGDNFEGPVLFDTNGTTYRSTKDGKIVKVSVEGGATIAPPVYPFTTVGANGQPQQAVITKPEAARRAGQGTASLGPSAALKPLPEDAVKSVTTGLQAIKATRDVMAAIPKISGKAGGNLEAFKTWAGAQKDPDINKARVAIDSFAAISQQLQKGAASEPDIARLTKLAPAFGEPEAINNARAENFINLFTANTKSLIANYKHTGHQIPDELAQQASDLGIDINNVQPYSENDEKNPYRVLMKQVAKDGIAKERLLRGHEKRSAATEAVPKDERARLQDEIRRKLRGE